MARLFATASFPWWIAGGVALELAVGKTIRSHGDMDVLILRADHLAVRERLAAWDCWAVDPPGSLRSWPVGERLDSSVHDVWCRYARNDNWRVQLMIDERDVGEWVSRRDRRVRAPLDAITRTTPTGIRYVAPHLQLFYKAKNPRSKDVFDLEAVLASGIDLNVAWLSQAIRSCYGVQHPWLERLI
ncbi:MAG: amino acid transporter [Pseudomonadota bacterium]